MIEQYPQDADFEYETDCYECHGTGWIIICCDDLCRAADECMHGDGDAMCHVCKGLGYLAAEAE